MNIPDKAYGAAEEAWYETADLDEALKAAAPVIAAQALREAATRAERHSPDDGVSPHWLRQVADVMEAQA